MRPTPRPEPSSLTVARYEDVLREIAESRCETGWGDPGLKDPPSCSCNVCKARRAVRDMTGARPTTPPEGSSLISARGGTPLGPHFEVVRQALDVHPNEHPCHLSLNVLQKHFREETHLAECANTPLMREVMAERDRLTRLVRDLMLVMEDYSEGRIDSLVALGKMGLRTLQEPS